jgi:hypothetical protein
VRIVLPSREGYVRNFPALYSSPWPTPRSPDDITYVKSGIHKYRDKKGAPKRGCLSVV